MKKRIVFRLISLFTILLFLLTSLGQVAYAAKKPGPSTTPTITLVTPSISPTLNVGETLSFKVSVKYSGTGQLTWTKSANLTQTQAPVKKAGTYTAAYSFKATAPGVFPESVIISVPASSVTPATFNANFTVAGQPKYLALGDSIPYGRYYTSLFNYLGGGTDTNSYVEQLAALWGITSVNFTDASQSGYNASEVYSQLSSLTSKIEAADVITLAVGGNDIMDAAARDLTGIDKHDIDWATADAGRDSFDNYWPLIIDGIESINPDVTLIVMTVYNPYHRDDVYNGLNYYDKVDPYFSADSGADPGINFLIRNTMSLDDSGLYWSPDLISGDFDYRVADVYTAFNSYGDGYDDKDAFTGFYQSFSDPHPNQLGQNFIYNLHKALLGSVN